MVSLFLGLVAAPEPARAVSRGVVHVPRDTRKNRLFSGNGAAFRIKRLTLWEMRPDMAAAKTGIYGVDGV